jgi:rSAM/selenodomain-associated transferase 2
MKLSVVIPVLNERDSLPATIAALRALKGIAESVFSQSVSSEVVSSKSVSLDVVSSKSVSLKTSVSEGVSSQIISSQIIVVDGGSSDGTAEWVGGQPDVVLVNSARGKGPQLNAGAALATGDTLLFLHADCFFSRTALDAMLSALSDDQVAGGAFHLRFAESRPRSLRLVAWGINLRAWLRGSATGDQGIFVRKAVFHAIGGAPDWPLFEDVELVRRIKRAGKFKVLKTPVTVSGRRYIQHGVLRTALLIYFLRLAYWLGVPPQRLKNWFRDARGKQKGGV